MRINLGCATPIAGLGRLVCQYSNFRRRNYVRLDACVNTSCRVDPQLAGTYHLWSSPISPNYVNKRLAQAYVLTKALLISDLCQYQTSLYQEEINIDAYEGGSGHGNLIF